MRVKGDLVIRCATAIVVTLLAAIAAVASYRHILEVGWMHGETGLVAYLSPITIDGLIVASSLTLLDAARRGEKGLLLSWAALALGVILTIAANVLYGLQDSIIGAIYAALPAVTLTISFELLMGMIRRAAKTKTAPQTEEAPQGEAVAPTTPAAEAPIATGTPAPRRRTTVRVAAEHVEAAKALLSKMEDPSKATARHLAGILPDMVARTRREVLRRAKEELGITTAKPVSDVLPGMAA